MLGEPPDTTNEPSSAMLGSSHAPLAGTGVAELARMYWATWHMCEPANSASQAPCMAARPPAAPVVVAAVKPANVVLSGVLQHASGRATPHDCTSLVPPLASTVLPELPAAPLVQLVHELEFTYR